MHKCTHSFWQCCHNSCNIARIAAILPEINLHSKSSIAAMLQQYCRNIARDCCCNIAAILPETNLHAKSSIAATLQQYCQKLLLQYRCNIEAIYCQKACISIRADILLIKISEFERFLISLWHYFQGVIFTEYHSRALQREVT